MLTDPLSLRQSTVWLKYQDVAAIPHVYGKVTVAPLKYRADGRQWVIADHAIQGIDGVMVDGKATTAYGFANAKDNTGHVIALLDLFSPVEESISVSVRGKPATSGLMTNPARIMHDALATLGGTAVTLAQMDAFRTDTAAIELAGVIDGSQPTTRSQADEIAVSVGAVWSLAMPGIAMRYPLDSVPASAPVWATLDSLSARNVQGQVESAELVTVVKIEYAYDWINSRPRKSVQVKSDAQIAKYGRIERTVNARWLLHDVDAVALGKRLLRYWSRPLHVISMDISRDDAAKIPPGGYVSFSHPYAAVSGTLFAVDAQTEINSGETRLIVEGSFGPVPAVALEYSSTVFGDADRQLFVTFANGIATITVTDEDGNALQGATVTISNNSRITNNNGQVFFEIAPGTYLITITADGFATQTITTAIG